MSPEDRLALLSAMIRSGSIGLHRCPNNGKIIESQGHDDKALCGCGRPNPLVPSECPGVHVKRFLLNATVDEYIWQEERRRAHDQP